MKISRIKSAAITTIATLRIQQWFGLVQPSALTALLFHNLFGPEESLAKGRDRVARMCEWLRRHFRPLAADQFVSGTHLQDTAQPGLLVTVDDARRPLLDVADIFQQFEIPLIVFVPIGWIDATDPSDAPITTARLITRLEHLRPFPTDVRLPDGTHLSLQGSAASIGIDRILSLAETDPEIVPCLWSQLGPETRRGQSERGMCTWSELQDLAASGIRMGSHSISHCRLAPQSEIRIRYEVVESRRILTNKFGACDLFAYPYGTWDVVSESTTAAIRSAGYHSAFLVHAGYGHAADPFHLPRIDVPDQVLSDRVFAALASGGQIPLILIKSRLAGRLSSRL